LEGSGGEKSHGPGSSAIREKNCRNYTPGGIGEGALGNFPSFRKRAQEQRDISAGKKWSKKKTTWYKTVKKERKVRNETEPWKEGGPENKPHLRTEKAAKVILLKKQCVSYMGLKGACGGNP